MTKRKNAETAPKITEQNWNNPFIGLKIDLPKETPPPPPPPQTPEQRRQVALSREDLELLKAFGGEVVIGKDASAGQPLQGKGALSFQIQRKGKGGKTVTNVKGLEELELMEQMELCSRVKNALGIGARFLEGVLELQGDQVQRAGEWFRKQGYRCK